MTQVLGSINLDGITDLQASTKVDGRENPAQEEFVLTDSRCRAKRGDELRRVVPLNIVQ
jgi:hypothetical protein|tara:strand:+ start:146 stop:322 length:177 start_codon:yes stop_codon:yes gene_type:complete